MTDEKKKIVIQQACALTQNYMGDVQPKLALLSNVRISLAVDYKGMSDQNVIASLHKMKLLLIEIGKFSYEAVERLKRQIDSNPDQPEFELKPISEEEAKKGFIVKPDGGKETYYPPLPITNEDLQDDNPVEGVDY